MTHWNSSHTTKVLEYFPKLKVERAEMGDRDKENSSKLVVKSRQLIIIIYGPNRRTGISK